MTTFDKELRRLVKDLTDTMRDAPGSGLAAPQIGVSPAGLHLRRRRRGRPPHQPGPRPVQRGDDGRRRGLPVASRACRSSSSGPNASSPPGRTCTATRCRSRAPATSRGRSSTRPTTSTASCSSTGSTRRRPSGAKAAIREAEWSGEPAPEVKVSPHPLFGRALVTRDAPALRRHARRRLPSLRALLASERHEVVAVLTRPDAPRRSRASARRAHRSSSSRSKPSIEVLTPRRPREPEFLERLAEIAPDCCPVVAYGALIPPAALDIPPHGWVNLHFSLLPAWRGAAPVQHALLAGDDMTGATTFRLEEGMDTGPYVRDGDRADRPRDTSGDLLDAAVASPARGCWSRPSTASRTASWRPGRSRRKASRWPPSSRPRTRVSAGPSRPSCVDRLVRASTPAPGAWTTFRERRLKLGPVRHERGVGHRPRRARRAAPASCSSVRRRRRSSSASVQPEGKPQMAADAWARGVRLQPGDRLI